MAFTRIEEPQLLKIIDSCTHLEALNLLNVRVNSIICRRIAELSPQLKALRMTSPWVSGVILLQNFLHSGDSFPLLEELHVPTSFAISPESLLFRKLARQCPQLRVLIVGGIFKQDLNCFALNMSKLQVFATNRSADLDIPCLKHLLKNCPDMSYLGLGKCNLLNEDITKLRNEFLHCRIEELSDLK